MSDVFISYAKEDRNRAKEVAYRLMQEGWSVFWDTTMYQGLSENNNNLLQVLGNQLRGLLNYNF